MAIGENPELPQRCYGAGVQPGSARFAQAVNGNIPLRVLGAHFIWRKCLFENKDTPLFGYRYQPGLSYEQPKYCPEKEALGSCASAASKSKSQVTVLPERGFSLRAFFSPSLLPTKQSASLVSFLVGFLGKSLSAQTL